MVSETDTVGSAVSSFWKTTIYDIDKTNCQLKLVLETYYEAQHLVFIKNMTEWMQDLLNNDNMLFKIAMFLYTFLYAYMLCDSDSNS